MVLTKRCAAIYNDTTTDITASNPPILESDWCQHIGTFRLILDPKNSNLQNPDKQHKTPKTINIIFDLPSSCKIFLWYHASAGFPPKESFHQCHPQQKLYNMAKTDGDTHQPLFSQLRQDSKRPLTA